jgi:hypothetical protein
VKIRLQARPCLYGPRGLIFDQGNLLVANQNVDLSIPGAILSYDGLTGGFVNALVPSTVLNAPPAPRGIILDLEGNTLFVASQTAVSGGASVGVLQAFDGTTGKFSGLLKPPMDLASSFRPRGVVIGPDGRLYVSSIPNPPLPFGTGLGGVVLRFNPLTREFIDVFITSAGGVGALNRPEGLVFGPDGNLYVTSFRANPMDTDKIFIFAGPASTSPGTVLGQINLDQVGDKFRAYAQALLFGPGGKLFVPITTPTATNAGQVRRYDVSDLTNISFDIFVPSSPKQNSPLGSSWFLTFGNTDPSTLAYPASSTP